MELKTVFANYFNPAAGVCDVSTIALNGGWDPLLALGTNQPLYWDQWTAMYKYYCVIAWKVRFEIITTDNTNAITFGFCPKTDSTALTTALHYKEVAGNRSVVCTPDIDKNILVARGGVEKYLLGHRRRGRMLSDDQLYSDTGSNPIRPLYGHIYAHAFDGSADPATVHFNCTLYQTIVFFHPIVPSRS